MTPYDVVKENFTLPFELYPFQQAIMNDRAPEPRTGFYMQVGTGKTPTSTYCALFKKAMEDRQTVVLMPPILLLMWQRWLERIPEITSMMYRGSKKEREALQFQADFILMSMGIFKNDYDRLMSELATRNLTIINDEATSIKNIETANYQRFSEFAAGQDIMLLTGTPLSSPIDAYAYIKLIAPSIYRNKRQFENLHVEERDFYKKPKVWANLDMMHANMKVNSVRAFQRDVLKDLPEEIYVPIEYELERDHMALYREMAEEQLVRLKDGGKLDLTNATALWHTLQQVIMQLDYFSETPGAKSAGFELIDQIMSEIDGEKIMIFGNYKRTLESVVKYLEPHGAVLIYGEMSDRQRERNVERFVTDPSCRVFVANYRSAGKGVDGCQHVCSDMLFIEQPLNPLDFEQCVGRLSRDGQKKRPTVRIAIASGTLQVQLHKMLLAKDALINLVQGGWKDLVDAIYGGNHGRATQRTERAGV